MRLIDRISEDEKSLINILRKSGADDYFDERNFVSCENFLSYWDFAKRNSRLESIFKDSLILKKKINIAVEDDELLESMDEVIDSERCGIVFDAIINMLAKYNDLDDYVSSTDTIHSLFNRQIFYTSAFISNKYSGPTIELNMPNKSVFKLVNGCKLMKALNRLSKEAQVEEQFEQIRIKQSQVMNEAKINAHLCLSIHPLDYITASYNNNGWESCMCWEEGDYRRGVIEMMNSPYVLVAYVESNSRTLSFWDYNKKQTTYWNSKRWREFFIVSPDGIFGIKGYPYWNKQIESTVLKWIRELFAEQGIMYSQEITKWTTDDGGNITDHSVCSSVNAHFSCGPAMYNDFYSGLTYAAMLASNTTGALFIDYSGESECVICGDGDAEIDSSSDLVCSNCSDRCFCEYCGDIIPPGEDAYEYDDCLYCHFCFKNHLPHCDVCEDIIPFDHDSMEILDGKGISFYIGNDDESAILLHVPGSRFPHSIYVCADCADEVFVDGDNELEKHHKQFARWDYKDIIPMKSIRFKGLNLPEPTPPQNYFSLTDF